MVKICKSPYPSASADAYSAYFEQFPYPLSDFQKYAIEGIVQGQHVLITAHTGSGKTLPALFAIDHFTKQNKKVIYTSPIKALSNQKYWEFQRKFPHISFGLMTGDIKTNPAAQVLIMTTEILMNYLYRVKQKTEDTLTVGSLTTDFDIDIETELECVVFDEVHYINDAARGHVWEQTMLMLPPICQMVLLSATIDNPLKLGEWIESKPQGKKIWLCSTETRVVPLTHYCFLTVNEGLIKQIKDDGQKQQIRSSTNQWLEIKSSSNIIHEKNYTQVKNMLDLIQNKHQFIKRKFVLNALFSRLKEKEMLPAIVFVFSRNEVEHVAQEITTVLLEDDSKIPYIVANECERMLREKMTNFKEYLELPECVQLIKLLEKGIGIHHSGMIPVLREMVELFISKNYIKVLVATESFAIGLDCPIKTAVFESLTKFDGNQFRLLEPHEYNQMSGRAGRRGIDTIGNVIHCNNLFPLPSLNQYRGMLCGSPQQLKSKFVLTHSLVFSLMMCNEGKVALSQIHEFVQKSMWFSEWEVSLNARRKECETRVILLSKKKEALSLMKTPEDVIRQHLQSKADLAMASHKKQKEITKETAKCKELYYDFEKDVKKYEEYETMCADLLREKEDCDEMANFVQHKTKGIIDVLCKRGFAKFSRRENEGDESKLSDNESKFSRRGDEGRVVCWTEWGQLASHFAEVESLIFTPLVKDLQSLTPKQLVGFLSCFTKITKSNSMATITDPTIQSLVQKTKGVMSEMETDGIHCENDNFTTNLADIVMEWCEFTDEHSCKYFIQQKVADISVGDFTKVILKIVAIVHEIEKASVDNIELLYTCSQVEPLLLKYIATIKSLYV